MLKPQNSDGSSGLEKGGDEMKRATHNVNAICRMLHTESERELHISLILHKIVLKQISFQIFFVHKWQNFHH